MKSTRIIPRRAVVIAGVLFLTVGALALWVPDTIEAQFSRRTKEVIPELPLNRTISGQVDVTRGAASAATFRLHVPEDVFALTVEIRDAVADLDILLRDSSGQETAVAQEMLYNETLFLSRLSSPSLAPGNYLVEILYQYSRPPVVAGRQLTEVPFSLTARAVMPPVRATLLPGMTMSGVLHPENAMVDLYRIEVPTGSPALRIDISDAEGDVDLFLNYGSPSWDPYRADHIADTLRSSEQIVIDRTTATSLRPGIWYLMVLDQLSDLHPVPYTLTVHNEHTPPASLRSIPQDPEFAMPATPGERAIASVVEILGVSSGGSGVLVSPAGHILTNMHVVMRDSGLLDDDLVIAVTVDPARPARELFVADIIDSAPDRDLALLQIRAGRYGQVVPPDRRFPYLPFGDDRTLTIGDPLQLLGYPSIGSTASRTTITYSGGFVAGFQQVTFGRVIKTDGLISGGNSGGAAMDRHYSLVGIPTEMVSRGAAQVGYVYPVSALPARWNTIISEAGGGREASPGGGVRR